MEKYRVNQLGKRGNIGVEIIAESDEGKFIGNIIAGKVNDKTVSIGRVGVNEEFRRREWGRKLLDQVENWAVNNRVKQMTTTLMPEPGSEIALMRLFKGGGYIIENGRASKELKR